MCAVIVDLLSQLPFGVSPDAACTGTIESQVDSIVYTVTVDAVAAADAADFVNGAPADVVISDEPADVVISDELSSVTDSTIDIVSVQAAAVPTTDCSAANPLIANRCLDCCDFQDTPGCAQCAPMFSCCLAPPSPPSGPGPGPGPLPGPPCSVSNPCTGDAFCNFDFGDGGFCEACSDCTSAKRCAITKRHAAPRALISFFVTGSRFTVTPRRAASASCSTHRRTKPLQ